MSATADLFPIDHQATQEFTNSATAGALHRTFFKVPHLSWVASTRQPRVKVEQQQAIGEILGENHVNNQLNLLLPKTYQPNPLGSEFDLGILYSKICWSCNTAMTYAN